MKTEDEVIFIQKMKLSNTSLGMFQNSRKETVLAVGSVSRHLLIRITGLTKPGTEEPCLTHALGTPILSPLKKPEKPASSLF